MQRGTVVMIVGLSMQIANWIISSTMSNSTGFQSLKGTLGTVTIFGWILFFAGFAIRYFDKKKSSSIEQKRKPNRK